MSQASLARNLLWPLVPVYQLALQLRQLRLGSRFEPVRRLRFPVVSIGNLSTGGSGKTPLIIALAKAFTQRSVSIDVLSRGYGRTQAGSARVAPQGSASEFGDEPLLIAQQTGVPVFVAPQRYDAGLLAETGLNAKSSQSPHLHLLDDGFQHRQLARDVDILLLDRRDWSDRLLPVGNLREPISSARRATILAIPAGDPAFEEELRRWGWNGPIWCLKRKMEIPEVTGPVSAFCGIARPRQFFDGLTKAGLQVLERTPFRDHHPYSARDVEQLLASSRSKGATAVVTTEKDRVRLGGLALQFPPSMRLLTAGLRVEIEKEAAALDWLIDRIAKSSPSL